MLLPIFVASASPVMVQAMHEHRRSVKITIYSNVDTFNLPDVPVYCKVKCKRKLLRTANQKPNFNGFDFDSSLFFPFLCDRRTRRLIQRSNVLFIMRGLPGSGKSTVVKAISSVYSSNAVCSADDYFLQNGVYKFDAACLGSAHATCQKKAEEACSAGVPVVIVDNTNVRRWEMKFYLQLASHTDYIVIPVQPKTAWRQNPEELAIRNKHGVDIEILRRKVDQFEDVVPLYYAWFLPAAASKQLTFIAQCLLEDCVQKFPMFSGKLLEHKVLESQQQFDHDSHAKGLFKQYYSTGNKSGTMLHCTAKFCGGGRAAGAKTYHALPLVQNSAGKCFTLQIHSICFSPRTTGARVQLTEQQRPLFDKPEEKDWNGVQPHSFSPGGSGGGNGKSGARGKKSSQGAGKHSKGTKKVAASFKEESDGLADNCQSSSGAVGKKMEPRRTQPLAKVYGRSAHITVACAHGVESRATNFDVLRLCDMEAGSIARDAEFVSVTGGKARYFGDGVCCVYFDPPLYVKTIYSGFY